ncbi:glutathionyl-hydroquinone reductase [Malassezia brasiliensis]|uniref:Glutathionyl-hydroquinone reductase n=1 Tax=Malassezia brasiliensis TaxID=1821822 RepID=A0AAF0DQ75_9BASI|nr:glutathionyl-hydroquinone reductase [Malassezia brasiliensis]
MSLFGSSSANPAGGSNLSRSVSFGGQENKPVFSFGSSQPAQGSAAGAKPGLFGASSTQPTQGTGGLFGTQNATQPGQSTGIFGQNTQQGQSGGLFGQPNNAQQGQMGGGLFGAQNNTQPGQSGGLFGTQNNQTGQPGGLFGTQNNQAAQSGGLFGGQNSQQQGQSGGLFGAQNNQQGQSGGLFGQQSQSGGLFGQNNQQGQSGGLFGAQNNAQQGQSGGLFGASQSKPSLFGQPSTGTSAPPGGLFGQNNQQSQSGGLFGAKPAGSLFGASTSGTGAPGGTTGGLFGASTMAQPAQPAQGFLQFPYYQRERFNELPDAQRSLLEEMDKVIQTQTQIKNELRARDQTSEPRRLPAELHELKSLQESIAASLESDVQRLQTINARVERDRIDQLQLHHVAEHAKSKLSDGSSFVDWLRSFYERAADEDVARIHRYRVTMEQIERHLLSLDQREQFAPRVIAEIIYDQNASFMGFAEQIATLHAEIETLKKDYVKWYQARYQSVRDPFAPGVSVAEGA